MENLTFSNWTNASLETTTEADSKSHAILVMEAVSKWINGFIIILGFITNSLVLIVLSQRRIGSQTTRIILLFLAATDLVVMTVELFIHYIPFYWKWFPIFYTDIGCGIASLFQASIITMSSWYLMLMTMERFTVVWFPMKAKIICTQKKILVACIIIPIVCLICFAYLVVDMGISDTGGYSMCAPKADLKTPEENKLFKTKLQIWIVLYFFVPAAFIVILNSAIVFRLAKAKKVHKSMRLSVKSVSRNFVRTASQTSNSPSGIRKATTLVIAASVTFVILMIPRGVSVEISLDARWDYKNDWEEILDSIAYLLQYFNHAINFFLYVLANNSFRKAIVGIFQCKGREPTPWRQPRRSVAETEVTQMTYVRSSSIKPKYKLQSLPSNDPNAVESTPMVEKLSVDTNPQDVSL